MLNGNSGTWGSGRLSQAGFLSTVSSETKRRRASDSLDRRRVGVFFSNGRKMERFCQSVLMADGGFCHF